MAAGKTFLHPDYGPGRRREPVRHPVAGHVRHPAFVKVRFTYADRERSRPVPVLGSNADRGRAQRRGDRHALIVDPATCVLYELYDARYRPDGASTAGSGAIWDLRLEPAAPGRLDVRRCRRAADPARAGQLRGGEVRPHRPRDPFHRRQDQRQRYVWPARHQAGSTSAKLSADGGAIPSRRRVSGCQRRDARGRARS